MPEIPLFNNFYKNPILIDLFQQESKLKNLHNGLELSYIDIDFLKKRDISKDQRDTLYNVLSEQYSDCGLEMPKKLKSIKNKGVFTITTGHQLCAFGGPQYFIHKIISVIKIAENLKVKFKEFDFIPMFWMATEDHDFQEISSLNIFNQNLSVKQKDSIGVGKLKPEIFIPILEELKEIFKNDSRFNYLKSIFTTAFNQSNWSNATRCWVNEIFKNQNLLIIDADDSRLKKIFLPVLQKELEQQFIHSSVEKTNNLIKDLGFTPKINPRKLNLFYFEDNQRHRIVLENEVFKISNREFSKKQIIKELNSSPEKFSPNVLMRPLYQESILPNLIYVGGPSEIVYWTQLKSSFQEVSVNYPILTLRDHFFWVDRKTLSKWKDLGFSIEDLSKEPDELLKSFFLNLSSNSIDLKSEKELLNQLSVLLLKKAKSIDQSLIPSVESSIKAIKSNLDKIQSKFLQASKKGEEQKVNQIKKISSLIHQNGKLKERSESFIPDFVKNQDNYIDKLKANSNTENNSLKIIVY